jgi:hypothetical protein
VAMIPALLLGHAKYPPRRQVKFREQTPSTEFIPSGVEGLRMTR